MCRTPFLSQGSVKLYGSQGSVKLYGVIVKKEDVIRSSNFARFPSVPVKVVASNGCGG
jgi:hypothetical protein